MTYLLDANALIALGLSSHVFHRRMEAWVAGLRTEDGIATSAITELTFVRVIPQLPGISVDVAQAKELLRRLKGQRRRRVQLLADALGADALPAWVRNTKQTTDGHLAALARMHAAILATLDAKIPGAFNVPS
ncbi:MAG TPA: PIN domain-containing protein [Candidatus Binatia bacterium]|nr:PIN domain-containing protein [Candidatus Binatia bacterium]